jgi:hypothetical protein
MGLGRIVRVPRFAGQDGFSITNLSAEKNGEWSLPVVHPGETGVAEPPVEREGAERASARSVEDNPAFRLRKTIAKKNPREPTPLST